ncbi:MAG: hypothetical protein EOO07_22080, partial [Chitinophagaceae bacterium]
KFDDYAMEGRTYRYLNKPVLYPFGYGLNYSNFVYSNLKLSDKTLTALTPLQVNLTVQNKGNYNGDEVVQLYIKQEGTQMPVKELKGFKRIHLKKGEKKTVSFELNAKDIMHYNELTKEMEIIPGKVQIMLGKSSGKAELISTIELK